MEIKSEVCIATKRPEYSQVSFQINKTDRSGKLHFIFSGNFHWPSLVI